MGYRVRAIPETMAGMPEEPTPTPEEFGLTLSQLEEAVGGAFMRQILDRLSQQTYVGGKRVAVQELPSLPKQAATTVHRVKVSLHGARPPVWRRIEIPSAMRLDLVRASRKAPPVSGAIRGSVRPGRC